METNYFFPLDVTCWHPCWRHWLRTCIVSNTLLIASEPFVQTRVAALLIFNFQKLYPGSVAVVVGGDRELKDAAQDLAVLGCSEVHPVRDDRHARPSSGVWLMSSKLVVSLTHKEVFKAVDLKLIVLWGATKAFGGNGLARLFGRLCETASPQFRMLALDSAPPKQVSRMQNVITNLGINVLRYLTPASDPDFAEIVLSQGVKVIDMPFVSEPLAALRRALTTRLESLRRQSLISETCPDALVFSDVELWAKVATAAAGPAQTEQVAHAVVLLLLYRIYVLAGRRAAFLFLSTRLQRLPALKSQFSTDSNLSRVHTALTEVSFPAFPGAQQQPALTDHPKLQHLVEVVKSLKSEQKAIVFCSSPFSARAVAECLNANRFTVFEGATGYHALVKDPTLIGRPAADDVLIKTSFLNAKSGILVSCRNIDSLGMVQVNAVVCMDHTVSGFRFTRFGKQAFCLLTSPIESLPHKLFTFDKSLRAPKPAYGSYRFRMETSKLVIPHRLEVLPVEFLPHRVIEASKSGPTTPTASKQGLSAAGRVALYRNLRGTSLDVIARARNETIAFLKGKADNAHFGFQIGDLTAYRTCAPGFATPAVDAILLAATAPISVEKRGLYLTKTVDEPKPEPRAQKTTPEAPRLPVDIRAHFRPVTPPVDFAQKYACHMRLLVLRRLHALSPSDQLAAEISRLSAAEDDQIMPCFPDFAPSCLPGCF